MTDTPDTRPSADDTAGSDASTGSGPTIKRRRRIISDTASSEQTTERAAAAPAVTPRPAAETTKVKRTRRTVTADDTPATERPSNSSPPEQPASTAPAPSSKPKSGGTKRTRKVTTSAPAATSESPAPSTKDAAPVADETSDEATTRPPMPPKAPAKPRIGDSRPAPARAGEASTQSETDAESTTPKRRRRGGRGRGRGKGQGGQSENGQQSSDQQNSRPRNGSQGGDRNKSQSRKGQSKVSPIEATLVDDRPVELDDEVLKKRRGAERKGRPVGRYQMVAHVKGDVTHIAVLEGRTLIEHYVSKPADDVSQIHGNIYLGRVQNVLPGMEAAFVDIGTPKNAVLYRGDVTFDTDDIESGDKAATPAKGRKSRHRNKDGPRIEDLLRARQTILCQVTKNPIAHKGARLTTEVSLPGRFVVLVPNSTTYGISKRLPDKERKRLRKILDRVKPDGHGVIVRTAAEDVTAEEIERDVARLHQQWQEIQKLAATAKTPSLLFREPDMAVRVIREEFNKDYRGVIIDDRALYEQVKGYMETITPALADRIEYHDPTSESLSVFERFHVAEQFRKAIDRKVWLPSGGSLIIEHTEALTVIDVNTGKNVGSTNLETTVFSNNLEAAEEIAKQLRLRDIGGIIVIDFVDMEIKKNRDEVMRVFRDALARDKTRTQAFDITDLGLVEMTRKRIGEGLLESVTCGCPQCDGRGVQMLPEAMPE